MKVSDIYGSAKRSPAKPKPEPKPVVQSLEPAGMLCRKGISVFLNHRWGPSWQCTRCGQTADIKGLLGK